MPQLFPLCCGWDKSGKALYRVARGYITSFIAVWLPFRTASTCTTLPHNRWPCIPSTPSYRLPWLLQGQWSGKYGSLTGWWKGLALACQVAKVVLSWCQHYLCGVLFTLPAHHHQHRLPSASSPLHNSSVKLYCAVQSRPNCTSITEPQQ